MPDYSKTQIYKIVSKDSNITNFYIGSTTNWTKRKYRHKTNCTNCNNSNLKNYNLKIYQTIRNNGGFENWLMILVEDFPCENKREAEKREQYWKDELKPDMNMINAFTMEFNIKINPEEFYKEKYQVALLKNPNYFKEHYHKINYKITCECGSIISHCRISPHKKTLKHIAYKASLNNEQPPLTKQITV